jgi:hypothetical protein
LLDPEDREANVFDLDRSGNEPWPGEVGREPEFENAGWEGERFVDPSEL